MKRQRPRRLLGFTQKVSTADGDLYVTVNEDQEGLFEVFLNIGKCGSLTQSLTEALGRMISLALRSGIPLEHVVHQLSGIQRGDQRWDHGALVRSVPDAVGMILMETQPCPSSSSSSAEPS